MSQNDPKNPLIPLSNTAAAQLQCSKNLITLTRKVLQTGLAATGTALTKDDSWMEEIFAWADKCKIPKEIIPRNKEKLWALTEMNLSNYDEDRDEFRGYEIDYLPEAIGQLYNLTELYLYCNRLTILPESIGQLYNLTKLGLGGNQLTVLPESIGQLNNLTELKIWYNQLTILPESIGQLHNLTELDLSWNQLTILPESIWKMYELTELNLRNNRLITLPESMRLLLKLQVLWIEGNPIEHRHLPTSVRAFLSSIAFLG